MGFLGFRHMERAALTRRASSTARGGRAMQGEPSCARALPGPAAIPRLEGTDAGGIEVPKGAGSMRPLRDRGMAQAVSPSGR